MLIEARVKAGLPARPEGGKGPYAPPILTWSPEVSVIADLIDEVRSLQHLVMVTAPNRKQGAKVPTPKPYARPRSAMEKLATRQMVKQRELQHADLVKRLLPHKREGGTA